ncbi:hypothetical protein BGZ76_001041 [Entomortierella beljakovae]|nr:hypothetical protein BGZ76_001041 [Entomortierella beljakovae]
MSTEKIENFSEKDDNNVLRRRAGEEEMIDSVQSQPEDDKKVLGLRQKTFTTIVHIFTWLLFTAFLVVAAVLKKNGPISVVAVAYGFYTLYLISCHTPDGTFAKPASSIWNSSASALLRIPARIRQSIGYAIFPIAMILTAVIREDNDHGTRVQRVISLCGLAFFLLALFATSRNRKAIHWPTVAVGVGLQFLLGLFVIRTYIGETIFSYLGGFMASFLGFSSKGIGFIVGDDFMELYGNSFLIGVLPAIIFFGAVIQVMYYYNIIQTAISSMGRIIVYLFEVSGVEVISACAAPFVGMSESAMLVGPYLENATNAEIHQVMASGFATISGSVYLGLISFGANPTHLITCCIMSVPCAIVTSKMRYPEEEVPLTRGKAIKLERPDAEDSFVHALSNGSILGMQLAIVIAAVLIGFLSLLGCVNYLLNWFFLFFGAVDISLQRLLGYFFYPFSWILGTPSGDVFASSTILGVKFALNEFVAFAGAKEFFETATPRAILLTTFACCSFANPSSLGSQISLLGKMAPTRAGDIAKVSVSAILAGALSTIMSACIAGIVLDPTAAAFAGDLNGFSSACDPINLDNFNSIPGFGDQEFSSNVPLPEPALVNVPIAPINLSPETNFSPISNVLPIVNLFPTDVNDYSFDRYGGFGDYDGDYGYDGYSGLSDSYRLDSLDDSFSSGFSDYDSDQGYDGYGLGGPGYGIDGLDYDLDGAGFGGIRFDRNSGYDHGYGGCDGGYFDRYGYNGGYGGDYDDYGC